jgi:hypothetical protein
MASGDAELKRWVKDQMHQLVQFSDSTVASFLISKAKECKKKGTGVAAFVSTLGQFDLPTQGPAVHAFASGLFERLPGPGTGVSAYKAAEKAAKAALKRNARYGLLDEDPAEAAFAPQPAPAAAPPPAAAAGSNGRADPQDQPSSKRRHIRRTAGGGGDEEEEEVAVVLPTHKRHKRAWEEDDRQQDPAAAAADAAAAAAAAEAARAEAQREADQREKEEFEER